MERNKSKTGKNEINYIDSFISIISHELRSPLSVIKGYLDLCCDGLLGEIPERLHSPLLKSKVEADKLHKLIENILDFSKFKKGETALKYESINPNTLIKNVINEIEKDNNISNFLKNREINFKIKINNSCPLFLGDEQRLKFVIKELITNSIKFSEGTTGITIKANSILKGKKIRISISDNGTGIPENKIDSVFKPFMQAENYLTRKSTGVGVGLALCKEIINLHKGKINAKNNKLGGSAFTFILPVEL